MSAAPAPRFVVWGDNALAQRLVVELIDRYAAQVTVIVPSAQDNQAPEIAELRPASGDPALHPMIVVAPRLTPEVFARAGLSQAVALALVATDDVANVNAALIAREVNPQVRLVVRMFNPVLGEGVATMLGDCEMISGSEIAAPAFVAAVLGDDWPAYVRLPDGFLTAVHRPQVGEVRAVDVLCALAATGAGDDPVLLPDDPDRADLVLTRTTSGPSARPIRRRRPSLPLARLLWGYRQRLALAVVAGSLLAGSGALAIIEHIAPGRAAYLAILTALGSGNPTPGAPAAQQLIEVLLVVGGAALIPVLTAIVVEAIVRARLAASSGQLTAPMAGHVIVVGLGNVGTRVLRELHDLGLDVVGIDCSELARGVPVARALGIPVIIGNANSAEILRAASVQTCRRLVVLSTDDVANLETALLARSIHAGHRREAAGQPPSGAGPAGQVRVVLRLFDQEFAARVERALGIDCSRSVSYLAAPAFAAAMMGREVIGAIPVGRRVLLVAELVVGAGSPLDGCPCAEVERSHEARLVAVRSRYGLLLWRWPPRRELVRTERILVVTTRTGLVSLLERTAGVVDPPPVTTRPPLRLLAEYGRRDRPARIPAPRDGKATEQAAAPPDGETIVPG